MSGKRVLRTFTRSNASGSILHNPEAMSLSMHTYTVTVRWDDEAALWYVDDSDVPGLATEAESLELMERKLGTLIPELLDLNAPSRPDGPVPFELIARKFELSA
jgi:hypothetical protein